MAETSGPSPTPPAGKSPPLPPAPAPIAELEPGLLRVIAPNPSPMTYWGTNTYLLGHREIAVIDPGPADPDHIDTLLAQVPRGGQITQILVSHAHLDHSPGAALLSAACGAPVAGFGPADAGRSPVMQALAAGGLAGGGEGVDAGFVPEMVLRDGAVLESNEWRIEALHTPGHMGNHLAFGWGDRLFCGDLVMGWSSSLVSPPDGDLTDFMASCRRLRDGAWRVLHSGHGLPIEAPQDRIDWLIAHRLERERQVLAALAEAPDTATGLAARIYTDIPAALLPAASRNVFAHLVDLLGKSAVSCAPPLAFDAVFSRL